MCEAWGYVFTGLLCLASGERLGAGFAETATYVRSANDVGWGAKIRRIEISRSLTEPAFAAVSFVDDDGRRFGFTAYGPGAGRLLAGRCDGRIDRYLVQRGERSLEFQRPGGEAILPFSFELQSSVFLPNCVDSDGRFCDSFRLFGCGYQRFLSIGPRSIPASPAIVIVLDDDLLMGTSRNFRDVDGRRIPQSDFAESDRLDYTYRELDEHDLKRMLAAGFNYFDRVLASQLEFLWDKPAFFDLASLKPKDSPIFPEAFYHPGFQGVEDFLDEPAFILLEDMPDAPEGTDPAGMARLQEKFVQDQLARRRRGRLAGLDQHFREAGYKIPPDTIREPAVPIWEEFYDVGCYELGADVVGFIHEGRYQHPETIDLLNYTFRTSIPRTPEAMLKFYFGFLRGAARVHHKDWGISIYGQANPDVSLLALQMAYDRGARWLWFWTSDRDHHLPFEEQLSLAKSFADYRRAHPRRPRRELLRGAADVVVLPYGFTFSVSDWTKDRMADLWQRPSFSLEQGALSDGTPYYSVLRSAARSMEALILEGNEFDVVVDTPALHQAGYVRLHDALVEGSRRRERFPWWIHYRKHFLLAALIAAWAIARATRVIRRRIGKQTTTSLTETTG
jgi:hypothetical protein